MRLATLREWRSLVYTPTSAPAECTLRRKIATIPGGQKVDGRYYVDLDEYSRATNMRSKLRTAERELAGNPLLSRLVG